MQRALLGIVKDVLGNLFKTIGNESIIKNRQYI